MSITLRIPTINIRNLFDKLDLDGKYVYVAIKIRVGSVHYTVEKNHIIAYTKETKFNIKRLPIDGLYIETSDGVTILMYKNICTVDLKWRDDQRIDHEEAKTIIMDSIKPLFTKISRLGPMIIIDGEIDKKATPANISSNITLTWASTLTSQQFRDFREFIRKYENIDFLLVKTSSLGSYDIQILKGTSTSNLYRIAAIDHLVGDIHNQYEYYSNMEYRNKINDIIRKNIIITQRASDTLLTFNGFSKEEFDMIMPLILSILYLYSKHTDLIKVDILDQIQHANEQKRLRKLKGVDPELFDVRRHDSESQVYSVKCQSDRQPLIYRDIEIKSLSKMVQKQLVKFWNFTESVPAYYHCPNKKYPHLSFNPHGHPLGYCLPCCKKLIPSEFSRQNNIDSICLNKFKISSDTLKKIMYQSNVEQHTLIHGKYIPQDRTSVINQILVKYMLADAAKYRLYGVDQHMLHSEYGGFIFSIIYAMDITLDTYIREILKVINDDTYNILDGGSTAAFSGPKEMKDMIVSTFIEERIFVSAVDDSILNWINIFSELTYLTYGIHIILIYDADDDIRMRMTRSTETSLANKLEDSYIVISEHDNGTYPIYKEIDIETQETIHNYDSKLIIALSVILNKAISDTSDIGIMINNILSFVEVNKKYTIDMLLVGKRGMVYSIILSNSGNKIYVPIIYAEYICSIYKTSHDYPDTSKYSRDVLYKFIDDYNKFIKEDSALIIPSSNLKYKNKYIGFTAKFRGNIYGLSFYHEHSSDNGRYKSLVSIKFEYDISSINKAIQKNNARVTVDPKSGYTIYSSLNLHI
jgi:hypothetical protein